MYKSNYYCLRYNSFSCGTSFDTCTSKTEKVLYYILHKYIGIVLSKRAVGKCNYSSRYLPILIIAASLFLSFTLISAIPRAYAHAYVIGSDPFPSQSLSTSPSKVQVHLSEPVDIRYSSVKVLSPGGNQIDKNDYHYVDGDHTTLGVTLRAGLKDGVYTVRQRCFLKLTAMSRKMLSSLG